MELTRSVLAGAASGSLMGVLFVGVAVIVIVSQPRVVARLAIAPFPGMSAVKTCVLAVMATVVAWTLVGAALGLAHHAVAIAMPDEGIGSPTQAYTLAVTILSFGLILLSILFRRRYSAPAAAIGLGFAVIFGWLLPWLAY